MKKLFFYFHIIGKYQLVQDINQLLKVRREKLANLQAEGKDPFQIVKYDQTHHTKDIRDNFEALEFIAPVDAEGKAVVVPLSEVPADKVDVVMVKLLDPLAS